MKNLYRGEVFYLIASPLDHVEAYRYFEDGGLAVVDGKIVEAGPFEAMRSRYPDFPVTDYSGKLIQFQKSHTITLTSLLRQNKTPTVPAPPISRHPRASPIHAFPKKHWGRPEKYAGKI